MVTLLIVDLDNGNYFSEQDASLFNKRSKVERGDIPMSMIGTIGNAVMVTNDPDFCIKSMALIRPLAIEGTFLIQLIRSPFFQEHLATESMTAEKCLLYVALTRAKKSAHVTSYGGVSEFVSEIIEP